MVHERAHGQSLEAQVFIGDFKEKMFAAVAAALGVPTIDRRSLAGARNRRDARQIARAERTQLEIRMAIADEFGLYAATLPAPTSRRHPWNELWPSFVTMMEYAPGRAGPVSTALQPLREEVAAIAADRQRLYLYGRLDVRAMPSEELDFLMREQFDLYVVALARSARVDAHTTGDLLAAARECGVDLDVAYLKTATPMGDFMPSLHGPPASSHEPGSRTGPDPAGRRSARGADGGGGPGGAMDERTRLARRKLLGILVPDYVIAARVAKWHDRSGVQGVIWDLSRSHGASMTGTTLNYYGDIHTLGELAAKTGAELQAIKRLGPVGMGFVREVLRLWREEKARRGASMTPGPGLDFPQAAQAPPPRWPLPPAAYAPGRSGTARRTSSSPVSRPRPRPR
jgi:hypothetical protein